MAKFSPVTHVIFDLDGLLLDTENMNSQIFNEIARKYNKEFTQKHKENFIGKTLTEMVRIFLKDMEIPISIEDAKKLFTDKQKKMIPNVKIMPGVEKLMCYFTHYNILIALATNSSYESIEFKLAKHKHVRRCFHHVVSGEGDPEIKQGKPAPDVYLTAAARFPDKPDPKQCLAFEDSPSGVASACCAGMQVVMVPDPLLNPELTKNATLVLESLCDFNPECFGLPPFPY